MDTTTDKVRTIEHIITALETREGGGFIVHRPFPTSWIREFDPFLLLDEMGPVNYGPGEAVGAPDHPHRGFETVTYLLDGHMRHKDSRGHAGQLTPGDVQWMTAGAGVVHSEMPDEDFARSGGRAHGFQIWVNLPQKDKMIRPRYQELSNDRIPVGTNPEGTASVRVIAGEALGQKALTETRTPIYFLHFTLKPGARIVQNVPAAYNAFAYIISGEGAFGTEKKPATAHQMVIFENDADTVIFENPAGAKADLSFLLLAGKPLNEPVVRYGPFVMNTESEIRQAIADYQSGKMGAIDF